MFNIKKYLSKRHRSHQNDISVQGVKKKTRWRLWLHRWRWYMLGGLALFLVLLWGMAASAKAPGDLGYDIKRGVEGVATALSFGQNAKTEANFNAATSRVHEATIVADRIPNESAAKQVNNAQTIQNLLSEFTQTFNDQSASFGRMIDQGVKPPQDKAKWAETGMVNTYVELEKLRLSAPPESQSAVLQAINTMQVSLATVQDALAKAPVTPTDVGQLTKLVSQGFLTHSELTNLFTRATSNRQLLSTLRGLVEAGQVPASALYSINYDLLGELDAKDTPRFIASVEFDELRKSAIFAKIIVPTAQQKQDIQAYLANYKFGQQLPRDASRTYIMPLIYGLNLTPDLADDLSKLDPKALSPVRRALYDAWKPLTTGQTAATDAKQLYGQMLQLTDTAVTRNPTLMERVQLEILKSVRSGVGNLALLPGWTSAQVLAMQGDFQQQTKDLKSYAIVQDTAKVATATLAQITTPLIATLPEPSVDVVRDAVAKQMTGIQQQLITAASTATAPQAVVPDLSKELADVQQKFNNQVAALGATNDATAAQVAALKIALQQSVNSATDAQNKLGQYVTANASLQQSLQQSVSDAKAAQNQALAAMQSGITTANTAQQGVTAQLAGSLDTIRQTVSQNVASLQDQLNNASSTQATTQSQLQQSLIAQANQVAGLQAKLNLSDVTYNALKAETAKTVEQLKTSRTAAMSTMQKQLSDVSTLHSQLNDATSKQVDAIKSAQAQLLSALQDEVNDKAVLKDQLHASISVLQTAQDKAASKMQNMTASGDSLAQQLKDVQTILDQAQQQIKNNVADTKVARAELQQSIDAIQTAQTTTQAQISDGMATIGSQVRQAVGELNAGLGSVKLDLAALNGSVGQAKDAIADIQNIQLGVNLQLKAQAQAALDLRHELEQPIAVLQQALGLTKTQVDGISTDVNQLKANVTAITQTQQTAQTQISQLLNASLNWSSLPSTLQFNQDQFRQYERQLSDEFAAKAAAIQAQFDTYKQQLDGSIQQLRGDVNAQLQQLKDTQAQLQAQLQQAQDQLKQVQSVPTTTAPATPAAPSTPATTTPAVTTPATPSTTPVTTPSTTTPSTTLPGL